jgi:hypothetical protein
MLAYIPVLRYGSMRSADDTSTDRLATVVEAAEILGITPDAVRSRLRRGTLKRSPERGSDGEVLVILEPQKAEQGEQSANQSSDQSYDQSATDRDASPTVALVESLQDQIEHLRGQLDEANRANAEHRRLLAAALERIPEIEAAHNVPGDIRDERVSAEEGVSKSDPRKRRSTHSAARGFIGSSSGIKEVGH